MNPPQMTTGIRLNEVEFIYNIGFNLLYFPDEEVLPAKLYIIFWAVLRICIQKSSKVVHKWARRRNASSYDAFAFWIFFPHWEICFTFKYARMIPDIPDIADICMYCIQRSSKIVHILHYAVQVRLFIQDFFQIFFY